MAEQFESISGAFAEENQESRRQATSRFHMMVLFPDLMLERRAFRIDLLPSSELLQHECVQGPAHVEAEEGFRP